SSSSSAPGAQPASAASGSRGSKQLGDEDAFGALLAAIGVPMSGDPLPAAGKFLPPGVAGPGQLSSSPSQAGFPSAVVGGASADGDPLALAADASLSPESSPPSENVFGAEHA